MCFLSKIKNKIVSMWENFTMNPMDRYLSQAVDHADLEVRLREYFNYK